MSRTESRRMAFEILYSFEIQKLPISEQKEQLELYIENNEIQDKKVVDKFMKKVQLDKIAINYEMKKNNKVQENESLKRIKSEEYTGF